MYSNTPNPPAKFTATMYGKTVTIEMDHSDFDLTELMEIFKGITIASGFEMSSWNSVIKELAADIHDYEREDLKEKLNEWKFDDEDEDEYKDLRHNTTKDGLDEWKARNGFGSSTGDIKNKAPFKEFGDEDDEVIDDVRKRYNKDSEGYESTDELDNDFFGPWGSVEEEIVNDRMNIIGQNGNEGLHYDTDMGADEDIIWGDENELETPTNDYKGIHVSRPTFDWDNETNDILTNINDSITIIKDRMEDIDMRMDNIDEQIGVLNADVANIEFNIEYPLKRTLLNAKEVYDKSLIESGRQLFQKQKEAMDKHNSFNDVVDMETGEVTNDSEVSVDGGFDGKALFAPYKKKANQAVTPKKMDKSIVKKGKIKDLKK